MIIDSFRHQGLRRQLVEQLSKKGIDNKNVLDAIGRIPRHLFMDNAFLEFAYVDKAFPIDCDQTISQPYTVAYQSQLLDIQKDERVLEIGTGSGYQSCVLAEMGARVFTIERQKKLFEKTRQFIFGSKYPNLKFFYGDGYEGLPTYAPFDKVIITAAAPFIPPKLIDQLKPLGKMVIPLDEGNFQRMLRITKNTDGTVSEEAFDNFSFVPMLSGRNG